MDWAKKIEGLKSVVLSAAIAAASAWFLKEYNGLASQYPELISALAVLAAAAWNRFRK